MGIGVWKYEISAKTFFKGILLASAVYATAYLGDACQVKRNTDRFFAPKVSVNSYDPYKINIKPRIINNGLEDVLVGVYELNGVEYKILNDGFPELPVDAIKRQPSFYKIKSLEKREKKEKKDLLKIIKDIF